MTVLKTFVQARISWVILALSAVFLESCALFFQYIMHLDPCVMCVYQRLAVLGIMLAGIIGAISPTKWFKYPACLLWIAASIWGLMIATELHQIQTDPSPFATCPFLPNFPSFAPLHEWFPAVFMPSGLCSDNVWQMFGLSMTQWMQVIFTIYILLWLIFIPAIVSKSLPKR